MDEEFSEQKEEEDTCRFSFRPNLQCETFNLDVRLFCITFQNEFYFLPSEKLEGFEGPVVAELTDRRC